MYFARDALYNALLIVLSLYKNKEDTKRGYLINPLVSKDSKQVVGLVVKGIRPMPTLMEKGTPC